MEVQTLINIASVAFGAGGFLTSFVVKSMITAEMERNRREDSEKLQKWVGENFERKTA